MRVVLRNHQGLWELEMEGGTLTHIGCKLRRDSRPLDLDLMSSR